MKYKIVKDEINVPQFPCIFEVEGELILVNSKNSSYGCYLTGPMAGLRFTKKNTKASVFIGELCIRNFNYLP